MRIAVVTPWFPSNDGSGKGQFVLKEVEALRGYGHDVRVIHLDVQTRSGDIVQDTMGALPVLRLGLHVRNPYHFLRYRRILAEAMEFAEVIHSHAISALAPIAVQRDSRPWIHSEHWSALTAPESLPGWARPSVPLLASLERLPDIAIGESSRLVEALARSRGKKTVLLVPCIVPAPAKVFPRPEAPDHLRIVSTGGLIDRKDPLLAIEVLDVLKDLGIHASLRWIGEGPLLDECRAKAADLNVEAEFVGFRSYPEVQRELAQADVFLAPTKGENFFVAAAEALVNGRPICAGVNGGHVEYAPIQYSEFVTSQTPSAYAEALLRLREKTTGVDAEAVAQTVRSRFAPTTVARQLTEIYQSATGVASR